MVNQNSKHKIALIGDCLANGGAEKVHALLSVYFHKMGFEVHNCIFVDWIQYEYSGSILNLGKVHQNSNPINRKITRYFKLQQFIKKNDFDAVIDFRIRTGLLQEMVISKFCYPKNTFYTVHSGILDFYFPKSSWFSTLIYQNKKVVTVSKAIQTAIVSKGFAKNVFQIYNPIDIQSIAFLKDEFDVSLEKYCMAVGRMNEDVKQFDQLIIAYSKSILPQKKIKLVLLGDGQNLSKYKALAAQLGLKDLVVFKGFVDNPFPYYQSALFTVISSKNEGFPNVILESFSVANPVISFDCFSGPNEIVVDQQNGLLVPNQDFDKLTEAMNLFIENNQLRAYCKQNTKTSLELFDIETIGKQWLELIKIK
ncbi:glycosyltransferase [Flavobacterium sp.]|uniref:glycosyltransferase n=1 Tax=Flavobacterium sp. TaxID=239 RepID=UPI0025FC9C6D|nr:glycosyltransferase [Flavobacterium sp.]